MIRKIVAALAVMMAAACATTPPNPIAMDTRQQIFIQNVSLNWTVNDAERAANADYAAGKTEVIEKLTEAVRNEFARSPAGAQGASFAIDVVNYSRVGAAMGNLIGGSNTIVANVRVVRDSDGVVLGEYQGVTGIYASNHGLLGAIAQAASRPDIEGIMASGFATNLRARFDSE